MRQQQTCDSRHSVARVKGHRDDYLGAVVGLNKNIGMILRIMQPFVVKLPPGPLHGEGFKYVTQDPFVHLSAGAQRLDHTLNPKVYSLLTHKPPEVYFPPHAFCVSPRAPVHSSHTNPRRFILFHHNWRALTPFLSNRFRPNGLVCRPMIAVLSLLENSPLI